MTIKKREKEPKGPVGHQQTEHRMHCGSRGWGREKAAERIFEDSMAENVLTWIKHMNINIQKHQRSLSMMNSNRCMQTHIIN